MSAIAGLEEWARARGRSGVRGWFDGDGWTLSTRGEASVWVSYATRGWAIDVHTGLLWAACVDSGQTVSLPCRTCASRGGGWEWCQRRLASGNANQIDGGNGVIYTTFTSSDPSSTIAWLTASGWTTRTVHSEHWLTVVHACRPCQTCALDGAPTGREVVPLALVVASRDAVACPACDGTGDAEFDPDPGCLNCAGSGVVDMGSSDDIAVHADRLQADGEPIGTWLAAWLRGSCSNCNGSGTTIDKRDCSACAGYGVTLGAYTVDMEVALAISASCRNESAARL